MKKGWEYKKLGDVAETIYVPGQENQALIDEIMEMVR